MKKIFSLCLLLVSTTTTYAQSELKIMTYASETSCEAASESAKNEVSDTFELKGLLLSQDYSLNNYVGYRLGVCVETKHTYLFQTTTLYSVPLYVSVKNEKKKVRTLPISEEWVSQDAIGSFKQSLVKNINSGSLEKKALGLYPELDHDEIEYITYKQGSYDVDLKASPISVVVVIKDRN